MEDESKASDAPKATEVSGIEHDKVRGFDSEHVEVVDVDVDKGSAEIVGASSKSQGDELELGEIEVVDVDASGMCGCTDEGGCRGKGV